MKRFTKIKKSLWLGTISMFIGIVIVTAFFITMHFIQLPRDILRITEEDVTYASEVQDPNASNLAVGGVCCGLIKFILPVPESGGESEPEPEQEPEQKPDEEPEPEQVDEPVEQDEGELVDNNEESNTEPVDEEPVKEDIPAVNEEGERKTIAITFDDGPDSHYTVEVLRILEDYGIKATFFVVGTQIQRHEDVLVQIHEAGHAIANHTYGHPDLTTITKEQVLEEIKRTDELIESLTGLTDTAIRAPYGALTPQLREYISELDRNLVQWTIDPRDWAGTDSDYMLDVIKQNAEDGSILLLHSFGGKNGTLQNTLDLLPPMIEHLQEEGFEFVTIPEWLNSN